jgi:hypothetical protein
VNYLSAMGCLEPGWSGICCCIDDNGAYSINLRAEASQLRISWRDAGKAQGEQEGAVEIIPIVRTPCRHGGDRAYFICPGSRATATAGTDVTDAGARRAQTSTASAELRAGVNCGRRLTKLYLLDRYFLCRHCAGLVYASPYEQEPWQRAFRRANRLRQRRFGSAAYPTPASNRLDTGYLNGAGISGIAIDAPEKPKWMPVRTYERLLDELLRAEIQAYQARADWTRRFVDRVVDRSKPPFTL